MDLSALSPEFSFLTEPASHWLGPHVLDLLEKAGLGALFLNESGVLVYCNVSARKALGLQHRSLIGLQAKDLPLEELLGLELEVMLKNQKTAIRTRVQIGEAHESEILIGPIRVGPLQERGLLILIRPITSRIEQLAATGERVAATCHNLKNELCSLKAWLSLLTQHGPTWDQSDLESLQGLSQAMKSFELRIEEVLHPMRRRQQDVVDMVTLVEQSWAHACQTLGDLWHGQLRLESCANTLHALTHRDQLDEVLQNVFKNAMEAVPGGWVHCAIDQTANWISIQISDEGVGPQEWHLLQQESTKPSGHGLGLADAQRALISMGGTLDLQTFDEGRHALVLRLPAA
ncbi:MAG: ATP-binding protein [Chlamydiia bacterium]